jgi:23S rRNA (uracil1939-C5)-methyltransferase
MITSTDIVVTLSDLVYGGDALGRLEDGRAVFVPFALPGEKVRIKILEEKPRHVLAELEEVLVPSELRIAPRCRHFGVCGGCHYQHMSYESQRTFKTKILVDQLLRIGKLENVPILPMNPSTNEWMYRNYVQFHLSSEGKLGYSKARSNEIVPIVECYLPQPPLDGLWPLLEFEPGSGVERVGLRLGDEDDLQIMLESKSGTMPDFMVEILGASVTHLMDTSRIVLAGSEYTWIKVKGRLFKVSAGTFFQVNSNVAEKLVDAVLAELPSEKELTILEVYSGAGLFSAFLAEKAEKLVAIESSGYAWDDFSFNLDEFDNVELYEAPAEVVIPLLDIKPDIVLADPPRSGLLRPVLQGILKMRPPCILYISCDPATLARDARYLIEGGYELRAVRPFDMFPQTYHIESFSVWMRTA